MVKVGASAALALSTVCLDRVQRNMIARFVRSLTHHDLRLHSRTSVWSSVPVRTSTCYIAIESTGERRVAGADEHEERCDEDHQEPKDRRSNPNVRTEVIPQDEHYN